MVVLLVLAACGWLAIAVLALALCAIAGLGDETVVDPGYDVRVCVDGCQAAPPNLVSAA